MKKIISLLAIIFISCSVSAQSYMNFTATSCAIASVNSYSGKYIWSDWYKCSVEIIFDINRDNIYIRSNSPQRYTIIREAKQYIDSGGGKQVIFNVVDQDGDIGILRLRIERNGNSQLYVDFSDIAWCYNVIRNY